MSFVDWIVGMDLCQEAIVSLGDGGIGREVDHFGSGVHH